MITIEPTDLEPFADIDAAKAEAMIKMALARAARVAPCINEESFDYAEAAKAILVGAILRWDEAGSGAVTQEAWGPYSQTIDTSKARKGFNFWPSEISELQELCRSQEQGGAFNIDTAPVQSSAHTPWCSWSFDANYCDCGVHIAGFPIYGV